MGSGTLVRGRASIVVIGCVLLAMLAAVPPTANAAFPGQNGKIAYSYDCDIWTIEPDGTGATQLTTSSPECDSQPAWSPDGEQIAFVRGTPGGNISAYAVHVMDADGGNVHPIAPRALGPAWSPDGTRIAFAQSEALVTSATDGTDVQYVNATYGGCSVYHLPPLAWSPDGTELVSNGGFQCLGTVFVGSCRIEIATGAAVCEPNSGDESYEDWSPDSRWILVGSSSRDRGLHYFGDGDFVQLTSGGAFDGAYGNAAWSPDGTTIVFGRNPYFGSPGSPQMYLIDAADGGNMRPLGGPHVGFGPDWQPLVGPSRADYKNAAKFCKAEQEFLGEEPFRQKYGGGANAHGKCVSGK
jgi:Tol biopolymer transport system component